MENQPPRRKLKLTFTFPFLRTEENKKRRKAVFTPFFLSLSFPFPSFRENAPLKNGGKNSFYFPSLGRCMSVVCYMRNRKASIFFFFFFYFSLASVLWKSRKCFSPRKNAVQKKNLPVRIVGRKHGTNRFRTVLYLSPTNHKKSQNRVFTDGKVAVKCLPTRYFEL